ncbi:MAG TPA: SDR family oxidoreductase [Thermoleophilaceae bacterium]|nr:SDR family oxidoreductase [Thermoleophilaceae bacterium]
MKILVTGGGGFIGSHLVDRLLADGHDVRVLDNFATGRRENLIHVLEHIEVVEGDLQSYERVHTAVVGCEIVLHQGALPSVPRSVQDPLTSNATNVTGTLNVLLAARDAGVKRVVYASSSSIYGANPELPKHEGLLPQPISPYAVAKLAGEGFCRSFHEVFGLETVALRYFNVFGPRQDPLSQYAAVVPNFISALLEGEQPVVFGDGEQSRDFTYVGNVVEGNVLAMNAEGVAGKPYNIAAGDRTTLNELLRHIGRLMGKQAGARYEAARLGDVKHSQADVSAAERDLGYSVNVSVEEGLRITIDWFSA